MSLRKAINSMCRHCIYDKNQAGSWRAQVEACTSEACPLQRVRPHATKSRFVTNLVSKPSLETTQSSNPECYSPLSMERSTLNQETAILNQGDES